MKILNRTIFQNELEWLEALKVSHGYVNENLILFCDHHRLANRKEPASKEILDAIVNFLVKVFNDFSIDVETEDKIKIERYFSKVKPNYYTIKMYIIKKIDKLN